MTGKPDVNSSNKPMHKRIGRAGWLARKREKAKRENIDERILSEQNCIHKTAKKFRESGGPRAQRGQPVQAGRLTDGSRVYVSLVVWREDQQGPRIISILPLIKNRAVYQKHYI